MNNIGTNIVMPVIISFLIAVCMGPVFIPLLRKLKFGQFEREEGMASHQKKAGTPTMGGIIILVSVIITSLIFLRGNKEVLPVLFLTAGFGIIGFLDDYIKVVMKRNLGLRAWQKMALQIIVTGVFGYYLMTYTEVGTAVLIPFSGGKYWELGGWYWVFLFVCVIGTVNGTNFTDGLDGLASSVTALVATFFTVVAMSLGSGVSVISSAVAGALLGFLVFNVYPAKVFMGDTGSLALGGYVAGAACLLRMPVFIVIVGFIYLIEVISVMLQVTYFKLTHGKRIFKMAPIHHHFEMCGWSETRVVAVFSIITALLCLVAFMGI